jgi:hypothetical protein
VDEGGEVVQRMYVGGCSLIEKTRIGRYTKEGTGEQRLGSPFPTSNGEEEMTYDQKR